jgi:hypothetical protein
MLSSQRTSPKCQDVVVGVESDFRLNSIFNPEQLRADSGVDLVYRCHRRRLEASIGAQASVYIREVFVDYKCVTMLLYLSKCRFISLIVESGSHLLPDVAGVGSLLSNR